MAPEEEAVFGDGSHLGLRTVEIPEEGILNLKAMDDAEGERDGGGAAQEITRFAGMLAWRQEAEQHGEIRINQRSGQLVFGRRI